MRVFPPAWLLALFLLGHCSSRLFPSGYESLWLRRAELNLPSQGSPFDSLTLLVERLPGCFSLLLPISVVSGMASWEVRLPCLSTLSESLLPTGSSGQVFLHPGEVKAACFPTTFFRHPSVMMLLKALGSASVSLTDLCSPGPTRSSIRFKGPVERREMVGVSTIVSLCPWSTLILTPLAEFRMRLLGSLLLVWTF